MGIGAAGYLAITAIASAAYSGVTQYQAGSEAKKIAEENAAMVAAETAESVKRMEYEQSQVQAMARAKSAASGTGGKTTNLFMEELTQVGKEEIDWLKKVGASRYSQTVGEGKYAKLMGTAGMVKSFGQGIQSGISYWGS